jgi:hypothetical protein
LCFQARIHFLSEHRCVEQLLALYRSEGQLEAAAELLRAEGRYSEASRVYLELAEREGAPRGTDVLDAPVKVPEGWPGGGGKGDGTGKKDGKSDGKAEVKSDAWNDGKSDGKGDGRKGTAGGLRRGFLDRKKEEVPESWEEEAGKGGLTQQEEKGAGVGGDRRPVPSKSPSFMALSSAYDKTRAAADDDGGRGQKPGEEDPQKAAGVESASTAPVTVHPPPFSNLDGKAISLLWESLESEGVGAPGGSEIGEEVGGVQGETPAARARRERAERRQRLKEGKDASQWEGGQAQRGGGRKTVAESGGSGEGGSTGESETGMPALLTGQDSVKEEGASKERGMSKAGGAESDDEDDMSALVHDGSDSEVEAVEGGGGRKEREEHGDSDGMPALLADNSDTEAAAGGGSDSGDEGMPTLISGESSEESEGEAGPAPERASKEESRKDRKKAGQTQKIEKAQGYTAPKASSTVTPELVEVENGDSSDSEAMPNLVSGDSDSEAESTPRPSFEIQESAVKAEDELTRKGRGQSKKGREPEAPRTGFEVDVDMPALRAVPGKEWVSWPAKGRCGVDAHGRPYPDWEDEVEAPPPKNAAPVKAPPTQQPATDSTPEKERLPVAPPNPEPAKAPPKKPQKPTAAEARASKAVLSGVKCLELEARQALCMPEEAPVSEARSQPELQTYAMAAAQKRNKAFLDEAPVLFPLWSGAGGLAPHKRRLLEQKGAASAELYYRIALLCRRVFEEDPALAASGLLKSLQPPGEANGGAKLPPQNESLEAQLGAVLWLQLALWCKGQRRVADVNRLQTVASLFSAWGKNKGPGFGLAGELRALLAAASLFAEGGEEAKKAGLVWEKRLDVLDRVLLLQRQLMGGIQGLRQGAVATTLQVGCGADESGGWTRGSWLL